MSEIRRREAIQAQLAAMGMQRHVLDPWRADGEHLDAYIYTDCVRLRVTVRDDLSFEADEGTVDECLMVLADKLDKLCADVAKAKRALGGTDE
jgi:hypothetical protein